jgi:hypothetical protein
MKNLDFYLMLLLAALLFFARVLNRPRSSKASG